MNRFFTFEGMGMKSSVLMNDISGWTYRDPEANNVNGLLYLKGGQTISVSYETCILLEALFGVSDLERLQKASK